MTTLLLSLATNGKIGLLFWNINLDGIVLSEATTSSISHMLVNNKRCSLSQWMFEVLLSDIEIICEKSRKKGKIKWNKWHMMSNLILCSVVQLHSREFLIILKSTYSIVHLSNIVKIMIFWEKDCSGNRMVRIYFIYWLDTHKGFLRLLNIFNINFQEDLSRK